MKINKALWFGLSCIGLVLLMIAFLTPWDNLGTGHIGLLMLALIVVAIMLGFPTAFTLMGMGVLFTFLAYYMQSHDPARSMGQTLDLMVQRTYATMTNDSLISIPLFVFMGYLVERANLIEKLFRSMHLALARVPGALAVATLATCAIFATATGIVGAVVTLMGLLAMPAMLKAGYSVRLTAGAITAGGCLGILLPPSVMLIVYGATTGVSVVQLYAGALFPGIMLAALYMVYVIIVAKLRPDMAPPLAEAERGVALPAASATLARQGYTRALSGMLAALFYGLLTWARLEIFKMLLGSFFPLAVMIAAVLGSIAFGLATPSEAAAMGAMGGALLALAYRRLNLPVLKESVFLTAKTSAMVCWLFVGSSIFSAAFALLGGQRIIEEWVLSLGLTPIQFLLLAQVIIFLLGWPLEWTEIIVIFMPIFVPLLNAFGIDPLFFGLLVALNLQTAFLSPPVAMSAFYLKGVSPPQVTLNQIFLGMMPFMGIQVVAIFLLYMFPGIGMWLPTVLYR